MLKNFFVLMIITLLFSCQKEKNIQEKENTITIIFGKRTFKTDTLRFESGTYTYTNDKLYYTIEDDFVKKTIPKNNLNKNDTLIIKSNKDIILNHEYNVRLYSLYKFEPGDKVVFSYENDLPKCTVLNKNNIGINYMTTHNLIKNKNYLKYDPYGFFIKNKRHKNEKDLDDDLINSINITISNKKVLDSLYQNKSIDKKNYVIYQKEFEYIINEKKYNYLSNIDLSIPKAKEIILNSFNKKHTPIFINSSKGPYMDSRIQFDKVLTENKIPLKNRDFLFYSFLDEIIENFSNDDIEIYLKKFKENINNKELIKEFESKTLKINKLDPNNVFLINQDKKEINLQELIKTKYQNKVVYVDFWASWCAPCRKLTPYSKKLHKEFEGKEVVFLYISIDNDYDKWNNAVQRDELPLNYNFLAINYPKAKFYKELNLKTIPRFLIFDKKGVLVNKNAPSPDNNEIRKEFEKYLK